MRGSMSFQNTKIYEISCMTCREICERLKESEIELIEKEMEEAIGRLEYKLRECPEEQKREEETATTENEKTKEYL